MDKNKKRRIINLFSDILPAIHDAVESFMNKHGRSVSDEISKAERVEKSSEAKGKNLNGIEYSSYLGYNSPANKKLRIRFNGKIETSLVGGISKSEYGIIRNALKSGKNVVLSENGLSGGVYSANVFYTFDVYGEEVVLTGEIGIEHALDAMEASKQYEQNGTLYDSGYAERERGIKARRHGNTPESVSDGLLREVQKMAGEEQNGQLYGNARGGKETKNGGREILSS